MIKLIDVHKEYTVSDNNKIFALDKINLSIDGNGFIAIVGKSGSGKTSLLNILGGLDKPTSGNIEINDEILNYSNSRQLDLYRNYTVSFVFQDFNLLEDYSIFDNVKLGIKIQGVKNACAEEMIKKSLKQVGLEGFEKRKISTLSGGQKQRVAIARALCKESDMVLCDEPTGNLDGNTTDEIFSVIKSLSAKRVFIVVTHDEENALKYADRIIKISDGKIIDDFAVTPTEKSKIEYRTDNTVEGRKREKKTYGLGALNCLQMVKHNIAHFAFSSAAMFLLLTICFTLITAFFALSQYNERDAFLNTLKTNSQYLLSVTKYVDKVITYPSGNKSYGYKAAYDLAKESDLDYLKTELPTSVGIYPSYGFVKPFTDFKDVELKINSDSGYAYAIKEAIAIDDFKSFCLPLLSGVYPKEEYDILIYDYMAASLVEQGIFDGSIDSVAGAVITDSVNGISLRISGILKSQYKNYIGISKESTNYDFAVAYLSELKAIFCYPSLIEQIEEQDYMSILDSSIVSYSDKGENRLKLNATKIKDIDVRDLDLYVTASDFESNNGIIISIDTLTKILNTTVDDITPDAALDFIESHMVEFKTIYNDAGLYPMQNYLITNKIIAICNENTEYDGMIYFYSSDGTNYVNNENGLYRQVYIGLIDNWQTNREVINYFWYPDEKPWEFYESNPEYYDEIYAVYDPIGFLITEADSYLANIKVFANYINYIVMGMSFIVVLIYTVMTLQRYNYKIGILKALGARTSNIILIFGLQLLLISLVAFLLSVPISYIIMFAINSVFVKDVNSSLIFFSVTFSSVAVAFAFATLGVVIVSGIPLLKLAFMSPIKTINNGRKKL